MSEDRITLTVPARSDYARTVRMTAAELAARLGMSYDEVDDVRMAAEEAFVYACDCVGEQPEITFIFTLGESVISAEVGPLPAGRLSDEAHAASEGYAEFILKSVCDEFSIERAEGSCTLRLTRRAAVTGDAGA
ncbi:MAG: ATP-binding protein [Coriobacteriia bacterium]|nr:ATP-binding protein [Coriobacteriia bacterium]